MLVHYCIALLASPKALAFECVYTLLNFIEVVFGEYFLQLFQLSSLFMYENIRSKCNCTGLSEVPCLSVILSCIV